jgi:hypothetical protein
MNASVQDVQPEVVDNIGADIFGNITNDLLPTSNIKLAAPAPEPVQETNEDLDFSDLVPDTNKSDKPETKTEETSKVDPEPVPEEKSETKKDSFGLAPEDLAASSSLASDSLPADLIKEEDADAIFKKDVKAKDAFLKERAYNKTLREQLREAQSALLVAQDNSYTPEEIEQYQSELESYKQRVQELEDDLGKIDLTRNPTFRQQYDDKINQIGNKLVEVLTGEGLDQEEATTFARQLIQEQKPSVREQLINDVAPGLRGTLAALGLQAEDVLRSRELALQSWKESAAAMEETENRRRVAELSGKVNDYVASAVEEARKLGNPYYMQTNDPEWNQQVFARQDALKGILISGDLGQMASLVAEGLTAADLRTRYSALLKAKRDLEAELEAVVKGSPRFSGRSAGPATVNQTPMTSVDESMALEDAITGDLLPPKPR